MAEYIVKETVYQLATRQEVIGELIRCKDCKNFRRWIDTDITFCDLTEGRVCEDDYCSMAERKTDEKENI